MHVDTNTGPEAGIRRVAPDDAGALEAVVDLLDTVFQNDPVSSWVFPDPAHRRAAHPRLMRAFAEISLAEGRVELAGDGTATALWVDVPAGPGDDEEDGPVLLREAVDPENERVEQIGRFTASIHPHGRAHTYLLLIAVAPERQGRGDGAALIAAELRRCDRAGLPAYLEASNTRSARLYERLGFVHLGEPLRLPGGPQMYPMWREPVG
ncbi:GNAT family N-acetyltransferase [Streptomyces sp. NPDC059070]|uniref:GNAT family N-acetyltransferase n=1 Tax=unclassified Streptomyces TaxID=2593676 RepID=UPI0034E24BC0